MLQSAPLSVSLIICESVLSETKGGVSAIRILDVLTVTPQSSVARFFVLTYLHSRPFDLTQHTAKVQLVAFRENGWTRVADAPEYKFAYGYRMDPNGPGAFLLTTEFNLNLLTVGPLGVFYVQLILDGELAAQTPITLLRRGS
jgi:hypothetical protein